MKNEKRPFIADIDPGFIALRAEMRHNLRVVEAGFRVAMREDFLEKIPPEVAASLSTIAADVPARFLRGLLPFFESLNEMLNAAEMLSTESRRSVQ